jgi:hypothetical protein
MISPLLATRHRIACRIGRSFSSFPDAVIHRRGELPYGSRQYLLLPPHVEAEAAEPSLLLASLHAHRNVLFGAASKYELKECLPLVHAALEDANTQGEQPQALATLHGLCDFVVDRLDTLELDQVSLEAVRAIATGIPRPGHSVVGQGTFRDGADAWKVLAREYVSEEVQLYQAANAQVVDIELMADTSAPYLKSAGGAMARLFFL